MWQLIINGPGYFETTYDLPKGVTTMGRADDNDIVLSGDFISRRHARLRLEGDEVSVEDLGSRNGTKVNGQVVRGSTVLKPFDTVTVGENALTMRRLAVVPGVAAAAVSVSEVKRFGQGIDIASAVILAKDVRDSGVMRVLDNIAPFDVAQTPFAATEPPAAREPLAYDSLFLLYKVSEKLNTAQSLQGFLDDTLDWLMQRVDATTAVVLVRHPSGALVPSAVRHHQALAPGQVPVSDAVVEAALQKGAAIAVADVRDDARFAHRDSIIQFGVDEVLCVPIGRPPFVGVLYLNKAAHPLGDVEPLLDLCTAVSHLLATGIEKFRVAETPDEHPLRRALERFCPPRIAERRLGEVERVPLLQLEERTLTFLYADLAGFTAQLATLPPRRVHDILSEFYQRATSIIFSFEGTLEKFIADGAMAFFGAPYSKSDDAVRATRSALLLRQEWQRSAAQRPPHERFRLKIALHTGSVLVGAIGSDARLDYTAMGEAVNVASWLGSAASPGQVLITGQTLTALGGRFDISPRGDRSFAGGFSTSLFEVHQEDPAHSTNPGNRESAPS